MVDTLEKRQKIAVSNKLNPYVDITPYELEIGFPDIHYSNFFTEKDELIIYVVPASTFVDKNQIVGYSGKSSGFSVRVAKGLTFRSGGNGGRAIRDNVRKYNDGDLIITNKRIVFIGKDDSFDMKIKTVSAVKLLDRNSFLIQSGRTSKNISINENLIAYAYGFINYIIKEKDTDLYTSIIADKSKITEEQKAYCQRVKNECNNIKIPKQPNKNNKGCLIGLIILVGFFILIGFSINMSINKENQAYNNYTDIEILSLENHPVVFSPYENAKAFYASKNVNPNKVKIIPSSKQHSFQNKEDLLLYMMSDASTETTINEIYINLSSYDNGENIILDDVISIALEYFPKDIMSNYYSKYRSFSYPKDPKEKVSYHYSWELNSKGIEYHNSGHQELTKDIGFVIIQNLQTNQFIIKINIFADDVSMVGHDKEWIEKNTVPWKININNLW